MLETTMLYELKDADLQNKINRVNNQAFVMLGVSILLGLAGFATLIATNKLSNNNLECIGD